MIVHVVLPADVDDPRSPSGGNTYGRRVAQELGAAGWTVRRHLLRGRWPRPGAAATAGLTRALGAVPDGGIVLLDGLVACAWPEIVTPHAARLRLVVVVHLPLADETGLPADVAEDLAARERATLSAAAAVVVPSTAAARRLAGSGARVVHVAAPGTDPACAAVGTDGVSALLCVAAVTPVKGHDVLVEALAAVADAGWTCVCAGPLDRAPAHVAALRERVAEAGLGDRVRLVGPLGPAALDAAYAAADLAVVASRTETYGMAVAEALARGLPLVATDGGALPDTVGTAPDGTRPALLVPPEDPVALAAALRRWFAEPALRAGLRAAARARGAELPRWTATAAAVAEALAPGARAARPLAPGAVPPAAVPPAAVPPAAVPPAALPPAAFAPGVCTGHGRVVTPRRAARDAGGAS